MTIKPRHILIVLAVVLAACGNTPSATETPTTTVPSVTDTLIPLTTSVPPFSLDRLHTAYTIDGNIYIQDGKNSPIQLTNSGKDNSLVFSEDGKKIAYYRGEDTGSVYLIDIAGSQEKTSITASDMAKLGIGDDQTTKNYLFDSFSFIPNTHTLLIHYQLYEPKGNKTLPEDNVNGLVLADTDTGKFDKFLTQGFGRNFVISPDGKMISVDTQGKVDLISADGFIYKKGIATYETIEYKARQYWLPNSREIIFALSAESHFDITEVTPTYNIWRYSLDLDQTTQISLNPSPTSPGGCGFRVSPDGNWIVYVTPSTDLYVGNLKSGSAQVYAHNACPWSGWSPDSKKFVYLGGPGSDDAFLGMVGSPPIRMGKIKFLGWVDDNHYIYYSPSTSDREKWEILVGVIDERGVSIYETLGSFSKKIDNFIFVTQ